MTALALLNRHLDRELNRHFSDFAQPRLWAKDYQGFETATSQMTYNDEKTAWQFTLELAGVTKNNVKVDAAEGQLSVTGEKTKGLELGKFEKFYNLPEGVDLEKIEAEFEDGILTVQLPLESKKAPKTIQIK